MKKIVTRGLMTLFLILSITAILGIALPVFAAGTLSMSPVNGPPGTIVSLTGSGFSSSASSVTVRFGTVSPFSSIVVQDSVSGGNFATDFEVPNFPRGTYTITAQTNVNGDSSTASFMITPVIVLSVSTGKVGDKILIDGAGFQANSSVTCYFDSTAIDSENTDFYGAFYDFEVTIPEAARGNHTIRVADTIGFSPGVTFNVTPQIMVNPASSAVGSQITVSGNGFAASSQLTFTLDGVGFGTSVSTNAKGTLPPTSLTVPGIAAGVHTLKVTDGAGNFATATLETRNTLTINPTSGTIGTSVLVTGKGYLPNTRITITYAGLQIATTPSPVITDGNGNFTATITVPSTAGGAFTIAASDGTNTGSATFTALSTLTSSLTKGSVGSSIPLIGSGFTIGSTVVIRFDDTQIGTASVNSSGAFSVSVTVPPTRSGDHKITATDGVNSATITFSVTPTFKISVASGNVGTSIIASGTSFNPNAAITIKYDATQVATTSADGNGSFSVTFQAPPSQGGVKHVISASDGTTNLAADFTMESTPPAVPVLLSPEKGAKTEPVVKFQWQAVTDPSGVTYTFQLSQDPGFNNLILNKTGLTTNFYQMTEEEKLKPAGEDKPYYWRVKATDGAFNESDWSPAQTFVTGFIMPAWGLYLIYVAVAVVVFIIGFIVGRRTRRSVV